MLVGLIIPILAGPVAMGCAYAPACATLLRISERGTRCHPRTGFARAGFTVAAGRATDASRLAVFRPPPPAPGAGLFRTAGLFRAASVPDATILLRARYRSGGTGEEAGQAVGYAMATGTRVGPDTPAWGVPLILGRPFATASAAVSQGAVVGRATVVGRAAGVAGGGASGGGAAAPDVATALPGWLAARVGSAPAGGGMRWASGADATRVGAAAVRTARLPDML